MAIGPLYPNDAETSTFQKWQRGDEPNKFEILLSAEFSGAVDVWTEWLCMQQHRNGKITLSSRGHEYLAEAAEYVDEDGNENLPSEIDD